MSGFVKPKLNKSFSGEEILSFIKYITLAKNLNDVAISIDDFLNFHYDYDYSSPKLQRLDKAYIFVKTLMETKRY